LLDLLVAYGLAVLVLTAVVAAQARAAWAVAWRVPAVIAAYHLGYGIGSWPGWLDALRRRPGRTRFGALTR
jgi:hypothetical protein